MRLYVSDQAGQSSNCVYQYLVEVTEISSLLFAVSVDYVCAEYKDNYRATKNFIRSNCVGMDLDNEHSDNPDEWKTVEDVKKAFPNVRFAVHYSRNHMKEKEGKTARPKFHVLFPIEEMSEANEYKALKKKCLEIFPYFDKQALDVARFFFGTPDPKAEIISGTMTVTEFLRASYSKPLTVTQTPATNTSVKQKSSAEVIPQGTRNNTMYTSALSLLRSYKEADEAYTHFVEKSACCEPPLDTQELSQIWKNAVNTCNKSPKSISSNFKPDDYSDIGQARIIEREYENQLRYSAATDYLVYNGSYWECSEIRAQGLAQTLTDNQLEEAQQFIISSSKNFEVTGAKGLVEKMGEKDALGMFSDVQLEAYRSYKDALSYQKYVMNRRNVRNIKSSLEAAKPMLEVKIEELDKNPFLLNTPSATYDLRDGSRHEHNHEDLITQQTAVDPGEYGLELWQSALRTFFNDDDELIRYVQEITGLASIGKVFVEALFIAYGDGRNGKSTFWNAVSKVLGTYSWSMPSEMLTLGNGESKKNQKAELRGKRLVISAELEENVRLSTSTVKHLCSTDEITAERKYRDPFKFIPSHQLVLYTNHLPKVGSGSEDEGIWRRLKVIPFTAKIEGSQDIKNYADYLCENAGGAILSWIIEGARRIIKKGYHLEQPQSVMEATEHYKKSNDWLSDFLDDCCEIGEDFKVKSGEFYTAYRNYCIQNDERPRSTKEFYTSLDRAGLRRSKVQGSYMAVIGVKLRD